MQDGIINSSILYDSILRLKVVVWVTNDQPKTGKATIYT